MFQLFDSRSSMLKTEEERSLWQGVSTDLITDEEDFVDEGELVWLVKRPAFRTEQLSALCHTLQGRLEESPQYRASHMRRVMSEQSSEREPPHKTLDHRHYISQVEEPIPPKATREAGERLWMDLLEL